ncbi:hypothetical protein [Chondromyces apiculatus]|uniref:DUF2345 domain-containing protein n=1 Tax=Chondromyces apiculatus DSM 436 TaxID=1192034 RepID=A0A017TGY8_9BACT|nr:hypothetical protein [Chondromyces apiculatus]EYF08060.1 Hypothetical protein CAP_5820 [Chondromyces apiculatus DSM 436]
MNAREPADTTASDTTASDQASGRDAAPQEPQADVRTLALAHGHALVVSGDQERNVLHLKDPSGAASLEIAIGPEGIRLMVRGAGLSLATTGALAIEAESLSLHGKNGVSVTTEGDARIEAGGLLETVGRSQHIRSARGDVRVQANDDVRLEGERIRLNS